MIGAAMRIVKVGVLAPTNKGIPLGVQGENRATQVEFDTRPWFREYPSGTVSAVARRDGDPAPYPLTLDVADGTAVWQVSDTDTAKAGEGAVELTMTSAGSRVRSLTFKTLVTASLTDAPVDDDAWYGWLDKAVVKVDETVQSAQRKMAEVDAEWTGIKADVSGKVDGLGEVAEQAASDAHHAKVDAQATAKALESAEGSVAKAEAASKRAVDASLAADDSAVEASRSALSAGDSAEAARLSADAASNSAGDAATSASNAADAASAASTSASAAAQSATDASNAKAAAQTAKAEAATSASNAATSASNAASSATAAAKSASDAAARVDAINVISPKTVENAAASGYNSVSVGNSAVCDTSYSVSVGNNAHAHIIGAVVIGSGAHDAVDSGNSNVVIGDGASAASSVSNSVAIGALSEAQKNAECAVGYVGLTREITHVSNPIAPTSASTKKYTDDNDAKTLTEAKKYTDANTSNALVGTVSGNLLHVEDAWPGKPLGLTIDGAYKQDGTPSPEAPVPITVIENPVLNVVGRNLLDLSTLSPKTAINSDNGNWYETSSVNWYANRNKLQFAFAAGLTLTMSVSSAEETTSVFFYDYSGAFISRIYFRRKVYSFVVPENTAYVAFEMHTTNYDGGDVSVIVGSKNNDYRAYTSATLPITLPAEHPYLAALPRGTHDEIVIDKDGNASLIARVKAVTSEGINAAINYEEKAGGADFQVNLGNKFIYGVGFAVSNVCVDGNVDQAEPVNGGVIRGGYVRMTKPEKVKGIASAKAYLIEIGFAAYIALINPVTYQLGKLDIPHMPETISNVWTDAELTTDMSMTYKRDINIAFENLAQAVVAAAAGE